MTYKSESGVGLLRGSSYGEVHGEHRGNDRECRRQQPRGVQERAHGSRVLQHRAPTRCRGRESEADERQRRFREDERRQQHAGLRQHKAARRREQMTSQDSPS